MSIRASVVLVPTVLFGLAAAAASQGATSRVSVTTDCNQSEYGIGHSSAPSISADGRCVVFCSQANGLGSGDSSIAWFTNLDGRGGFGPIQVVTADVKQPKCLELALIDADGRPDVLTASDFDGLFAWFYNNLAGSGEFHGPQAIASLGSKAGSVAAADLDGDGDADAMASFVVVNDGVAQWFPNDGVGGLGDGRLISAYANNATALFPADVDGDGDLDVAFAAGTPNRVVWQENSTGLGDFSCERVVANDLKDALATWAADFDGDGDLDVVANTDNTPPGPRIAWYRNADGQGQFVPGQVLSTLDDPAALHAGDIDGDGDQDILATHENGGFVQWFPNLDGLGGFGAPQVIASGVPTPRSVQSVDLDADGDQDVLMASNGWGEVSWFRNTGGGSFAAKVVIGASVDAARCVRAVDLDGDLDLDVLASKGNDGEVFWYRNLGGANSFSAKLVIDTVVDQTDTTHALDVDADGDLDVISASISGDQVFWYRNLNGLGSFGAKQVISSVPDGPCWVSGADMDGDGDGDVLSVSRNDHRVAWYENTDGLGNAFVMHDVFDHDGSNLGRAVLPADIDGDGDPDVLAAAGGHGAVTWYENPDGQAHFGGEHVVGLLIDPKGDLSGGDLDGDGDVDLVAAAFNQDRVVWYRNLDGLGTFGPSIVLSNSTELARSVRTADLDGDGDRDVLQASYDDDTVSWFENLDGAGSFGPEIPITTTADGAIRALAGDIDADGDLDVLTLSFVDNVTAWYENTDGQAGILVQHVIHDGYAVGATAAQLADVDLDGDSDVVLASAYPNPTGLEAYVYDRLTLETTWVSKTLNAAPSAAQTPVISADGRYTAFVSNAEHMVPDGGFMPQQVYVNDRVTGVTTRVSVSSAGVKANHLCFAPSISADGRFVAFESFASNLVPGDVSGEEGDVFLHDRQTGQTVVVGMHPGGVWPGWCGAPDFASGGTCIAFASDDAYDASDTNGKTDVFVYELSTGAVERASLGTGGTEILEGAVQPSVSADGRFVAFRTHGALVPADTNIWGDAYVYDRATQVAHLASVGLGGSAGNNPIESPRISDDGRYVTFVSRATDLVPGTTGFLLRAYRRDLVAGVTVLMSVASDGTPAAADIVTADLSRDGQFVAFDSVAANLVPSDVDAVKDVFVHELEPWFPLGCDEPGAIGATLLQGNGSLLPHSAGRLDIGPGLPSGFALLFVSLQSNPVPFKGGLLMAWPAILQIPLFLNPAGKLALNFQWPAGIPSGTQVFFHVALADPSAIFGAALSTALRSVTP